MPKWAPANMSAEHAARRLPTANAVALSGHCAGVSTYSTSTSAYSTSTYAASPRTREAFSSPHLQRV
jgi:hypothetical protein